MQSRADNHRWLLTLTLLNTIILCFGSLPAVLTDPIPHSILANGFYFLVAISQNFLFASLLGIFLLPVFLWVNSDRKKIIISIVFVMFLLFASFMNAKVFSFWRIYIDGSVLRLYAYGGSQVFEMSSAMIMWLWVAGVVFLVLSFFIILVSRKLSHYFDLKKWFCFFIVIYIFSQSLFIFLITQNNVRFLQYTLKVPYFYNLSWANILQKSNIRLFPKNALPVALKNVLSNNQKLNYPLHPLQYHLPSHPLNVLLIVVDTLRYDMINKINMPNVYHFSRSANQFLDNISGGDCTRPGIFSLFYSIPSTYWNAVVDHHQGSILIRAFQKNHYQLGLFASAPLISPPFDQTVFATVTHLQKMTPGLSSLDRDKKITEEMQQFLNKAGKNQKPFFGFLFYDAPHAYNTIPLQKPFHPTQFLNYFSINNDTPPTPIYNLYKNSVFADDQLIEKIIQTINQNHLMKNTVVIITSDHGQEFNEDKNNYWEHASGFSKYQMRTPMIIAWPNHTAKIYHDQTTHFDLAPTLLKRVLGVTNPARDYSVGDDFFSKKQPNFVIAGNYAYFALVMKNNIMQFHASGLYRFTDLKMRPVSDQKIAPRNFTQALQEMMRYHTHAH